MRAWILAVAVVTLTVVVPPAALGDHTEDDRLRCDGGWCDDGLHHVLDCEGGSCEGDARRFPTIVNPHYDDGRWLAPDDLVLATTIGDTPRAYPIRVVNYFETIEETLGGEPVIVTYCPLCGSGIVFSRQVDNETLTLYNSGEIWRNDLVMYDVGTGSRWTQVGGEAIQGPRHGETLELLAARIVEWGTWKEAHPDTRVLARPVDEDGSALAPYGRDPYTSYRYSEGAPQGHDAHGTAWHPKTRIVGVAHGEEALALPLPAMRTLKVHQARVGGLDVVAGFAGEGVHVYERGDRSFEPGPVNGSMVDQDGTVWSIASGESEEGHRLEEVPTESLFWFAWLSFNPDTEVLNATLAAQPELESADNSIPTPGAAGLVPIAGLVAIALARRGQAGNLKPRTSLPRR